MARSRRAELRNDEDRLATGLRASRFAAMLSILESRELEESFAGKRFSYQDQDRVIGNRQSFFAVNKERRWIM
jgi:hypothetical protein